MDAYRDAVYAANADLNWHDMETVEADVVWYHGFWALVVDCQHCGKKHRHNGGKVRGRRPTRPVDFFRPCMTRTLYRVVPKPEPPPSGKPLYTAKDYFDGLEAREGKAKRDETEAEHAAVLADR
jgi:hypothetical protein